MALTALILALLAAPAESPAPADSTPPAAETSPPAAAEAPAPAPAREESPGSPTDLVPPVLLPESAQVPYPAGAPPHTGPIDVVVKLRVEEDGSVSEVRLVTGAGEPFDAAVLLAARGFRFTPARYEGKPVRVEITFTQRFEPPRVEPPPKPKGVLRGLLVERGTENPVAEVTVAAERQAEDGTTEEHVTQSDAEGRFELELPPGTWRVRLVMLGYEPFLQEESIAARDVVHIKYLMQRTAYDPYETLIIGRRERVEISRTTLTDREIRRMPGTFGDPFRIIDTLPGVSQVSALLPIPLVRGSSPGTTGILLDGVPLPMLYHLLAGPSVIHPEIISQVDFYGGGFPVEFGGYTGGILNGTTRTERRTKSRYELDLNLLQSGAFVREQVDTIGASATVAGRYGYPSLILSLANPDIGFQYWDYQARLDAGDKDDGWSIFFLGARDKLTETTRPTDENGFPLGPERKQTIFEFEFHRLDLRGWYSDGPLRLEAGLLGGFEQAGIETMGRDAWVLQPRGRYTLELSEQLRLRGGVDLQVFDMTNRLGGEEVDQEGESFQILLFASGRLDVASAHTDLVWTPTPRWVVVPGVRADVYHSHLGSFWNVDPRLSARYHLRDQDVGGVWLKAGVGWFHQPPRLFVPMPGAEFPSDSLGLSAAIHSNLGAELQLRDDLELDVTGYFNYMDPVYLDLTVNPLLSEIQQPPNTSAPTVNEYEYGTSRPLVSGKGVGRSYGVELMLRRRDRGDFFGWVSYSLSWSQRRLQGAWVPFDYDRRHVASVVLGLRLPRNWEVGGRLSAQSGTPVTTAFGYNETHLDPQWRVDVRIDKRAVWNEWMLDFYLDIVNMAVSEQTIGLTDRTRTRFLLPTIGFRAVL